jgi:hypothetical protein
MANPEQKEVDSNKNWSKVYFGIVGLLVAYIVIMYIFSKAF